ncbi:hypothetical protein BR93DRAFT_970112 [Coniochaeta sp. PMI_546]|nr:hypothetical protein BR93DRAFT_970112 [Coniochaeta sp. PMI_546]
MIHFDDLDPVALALIEELPELKREKKTSREKTTSRWFHRKGQQVTGGEPAVSTEVIFGEKSPPAHRPAEPSSPSKPVPLDASKLPGRSGQREKRVLEGTSQSAPVPVHVPRPTRRQKKKAGKLPELPEDVQWRKPPQAETEPPPVPPKPISPKLALTIQGSAVAQGHTHRPSGIRLPGSTAAAPPRRETPSHVRDRHAPLWKPASKQRLTTPFQQSADVPMLTTGQSGNHAPPTIKAYAGSNIPERGKDSILSAPPAIVSSVFEQPTCALVFSASHPHYHGSPPVQDRESRSKVLDDKAESILPTRSAVAHHPSHSTPELPMTWKYAMGTPSSFEQALDDVVRKLDAMEPKQSVSEDLRTAEGSKRKARDAAVKQDGLHEQCPKEPQTQGQKIVAKATDLSDTVAHEIQPQLHKAPSRDALLPESKLKRAKAMRRLRKPDDAEQPSKNDVVSPRPVPSEHVPAKLEDSSGAKREKAAETKKGDIKISPVSVEDEIVDHQDRYINDRDVLRGLKLAVSAACDENLDFWIRQKTGLRLRRFLADLKTFEDLEPEDGDNNVGKKGPKTGRDGADEEEAALGDNEADPDDRKARRRGAEKKRMDKGREFGRHRKHVNKE